METLVEKPCFYCAESCAGQPRVKDRQGRYAHKACQQAFSKPEPRSKAKAGSSRSRSGSDPKNRPRPAPQPDFLDELPDLFPTVYHTVAPCPSCGRRVHPRAVMCTNCGTDLTTRPQQMIELKPLALPPQPPLRLAAIWVLGVLTGAAAGAAIWTAIAPAFSIRISLPEALIGAAMGAGVLIAGYLSRIFSPR